MTGAPLSDLGGGARVVTLVPVFQHLRCTGKERQVVEDAAGVPRDEQLLCLHDNARQRLFKGPVVVRYIPIALLVRATVF